MASTVSAQALAFLYIAGANAFRADEPPGEQLPPPETMHLLKPSSVPEAGLRAIASRSHLDPATARWLEQIVFCGFITQILYDRPPEILC